MKSPVIPYMVQKVVKIGSYFSNSASTARKNHGQVCNWPILNSSSGWYCMTRLMIFKSMCNSGT